MNARTVSESWSPYLWWTSWSPDGRFLLASDAASPEIVVIRDLAGRVLGALRGHEAGVNAAVWSPAGDSIATAAWDGTLRLWSHRGEQQAVISAATGGSVECAAWAPDGTALAIVGSDGSVRLYRGMPPVLTRKWRFPGALYSVAWCPSSESVTVAGSEGWAHALRSGGNVIHRKANAPAIEAAWHADGEIAAVTCDDGSVWIDDGRTEPRCLFSGSSPARGVAWSSLGYFAVSDSAGSVRGISVGGTEHWSRTLSREVVALRWRPGSTPPQLFVGTRGSEALVIDVPEVSVDAAAR